MKTIRFLSAALIAAAAALILPACGGPGYSPPTTAQQSFIIDSSYCSSDTLLRSRYFDVTAGGTVIATFGGHGGTTHTDEFSCVPGHTVCYGAETIDQTASFGVGYNNTARCTNCCTTCAGGTYAVSLVGCP